MPSLLARLRAKGGRASKKAAETEDTEDEAAGAAAETEEEAPAAAEGDGEDEEDTAAEEGDGEDEEEDDTPEMAAARASGRAAERRRWSEVMGHAAAAGRTAAAVRILGKSDMPAADVVGLLGDLPKGQASGQSSGFTERMRGQRPPAIGSDGGKGAETPGSRLAARMSGHRKQPSGAKRPGRTGE